MQTKQNNDMGKKPKLTKEQSMFVAGKEVLDRFDKIEETRPLTATEELKRDEVKTILLQEIMKFGTARAKSRMCNMRNNSDDLEEVKQEIACKFFKELKKYDPTKATPSTYFVKYFDEVISKFTNKYSKRLTDYDAKNVTKVKKTIQEYEKANIEWDVQMIATKTKLSNNVVKKTLAIANNSQSATLEEAFNVVSKQPTPEEFYLKNERIYILWTEIVKSLTYDELEFFMSKVNLNEEKELKFKQLAKLYGITEREAKQRYSAITAKLNSNSVIQGYKVTHNKNTELSPKDIQASLNDATADLMEYEITKYLSNKDKK